MRPIKIAALALWIVCVAVPLALFFQMAMAAVMSLAFVVGFIYYTVIGLVQGP